jgi:hypothetical protein
MSSVWILISTFLECFVVGLSISSGNLLSLKKARKRHVSFLLLTKEGAFSVEQYGSERVLERRSDI